MLCCVCHVPCIIFHILYTICNVVYVMFHMPYFVYNVLSTMFHIHIPCFIFYIHTIKDVFCAVFHFSYSNCHFIGTILFTPCFICRVSHIEFDMPCSICHISLGVFHADAMFHSPSLILQVPQVCCLRNSFKMK